MRWSSYLLADNGFGPAPAGQEVRVTTADDNLRERILTAMHLAPEPQPDDVEEGIAALAGAISHGGPLDSTALASAASLGLTIELEGRVA